MSRTKNKRSQKRHDKPGRPSKKQRAFNGGRKRLDIFDNIENVSEKTLYRRAEEFAAQRNNNVKFIELALKIARKKNGCDDSATIIETNENEKYDGDSALSFSLDLDLSVHQYRALVADCASHDVQLYSKYHHLIKAKKNCLVNIKKHTDTEVFVSLQGILDKSIERLCSSEA
uniref:Uncharacterized protein n=1 Tax=Trichogramma kaykai TaxID=54128 RepID=A0ABD2XKI0_9HYME